MSNLQPNCCLEFDFQKVDQHDVCLTLILILPQLDPSPKILS